MSFFNVRVIGLESIEQDVLAETSKIEAFIPDTLNFVGSELSATLKKHILEDWYNGYTPEEYKRRTDNNSLGTPLASDKNIDISVSGKTLNFDYEPTGGHKEERWNTRYGDDLITSIQTGKLMGNPPPRPFWNNFIREAENGVIMQSFINNMAQKGYNMVLDNENSDLQGLENESCLEEQ